MIDQIISFFNDIPSWQRTLILAGGLTFFWVLEGVLPILRMPARPEDLPEQRSKAGHSDGGGEYQRTKHLGINLFFTLTTLIVNFVFATLIVLTSDWAVSSGFGIVQMISMPVIVQIVVGLLILDLVGAYLIHWIEHKVYWMWRFHIIHHSDLHVDTSTALRHHPGESVFRAVFTTLAVLIAGAPIWLVMLYQSLSALASQFNHANLHLPGWIEKWARWIIVTPGMHRVHHHHTQPYTDTNYGNIFSIWDRLFRTYSELNPNEIVFGLDVYRKSDSHLGDLLKVPVDGESYKREDRSEVK